MEDLRYLCRICLNNMAEKQVNSTLLDDFVSVSYISEDILLHEVILYSFGIKMPIYNGKSNLICDDCLLKVRDSYTLKKMCENAEATFANQFFENDIQLDLPSIFEGNFIKTEETDIIHVQSDEKTCQNAIDMLPVTEEFRPQSILQEVVRQNWKNRRLNNLHSLKCKKVMLKRRNASNENPILGIIKQETKTADTCDEEIDKRAQSVVEKVDRLHLKPSMKPCDKLLETQRNDRNMNSRPNAVQKIETSCNEDMNKSSQPVVKKRGKRGWKKRRNNHLKLWHANRKKLKNEKIANTKDFSVQENQEIETGSYNEEKIIESPNNSVEFDKYFDETNLFKVLYSESDQIESEDEDYFQDDVPDTTPIAHCDSHLLCYFCGHTFTKNHYNTHIQRRHVKPPEKSFKCDQCPSTFYFKDRLRGHMEGVHQKRFICQICGKRFGKINHLTVHMRQHTGEHPYKCKLCDCSFKQNVLLRRHMSNTHHAAK